MPKLTIELTVTDGLILIIEELCLKNYSKVINVLGINPCVGINILS